jgi:hypothetical protein
VALVPLLFLAFDPGGWSPFGPAKWLVLSALGAAAIAATCAPLVSGAGEGASAGPGLDRRTAGLWVVLLVLVGAAAVRGVDARSAWLGTAERHLGVVTWVLFAGSFAAAQRAGAAAVRPVAGALVVALAGLDAWAVAEWAGHPPVRLAGDPSRFGGPFGSAALLGGAVVLALPAALALAADRSEHRWWRVAGAGAAAAATVPLLGSESRAALVALAAGAAVLGWTRRRWLTGRRRWAVVGAAAALVALVAVTPVAGRLADAVTGDAGGRGRLDEWRIGLIALGDRPGLGAGPEGYRITFPTAVDDDYVRRYGRATVTDRAHDGPLDVALAAGLPAAIAFCAMGFVVVRRAGHVMATAAPTAVGLAVAVVGFAVHELLLFPTAELDPVFWIAAGLVVATARTEAPANAAAPQRRGPTRVRRVLAGTVAAGAALAAAGAVVAGGLDLVADRHAHDALDRAAAGDATGALAAADRARRLRPDELRFDLLSAALASQPGTAAGLATALDRVEHGLTVSPHDPVLRQARADLLARLAHLTRTPTDEIAAVAAWQDLLGSDPRNPMAWLGLGRTAAEQGDVETAEPALHRAQHLAPHDPAPSTALALLYLDQGRTADALAAAQRAVAIAPGDAEARRALTLAQA